MRNASRWSIRGLAIAVLTGSAWLAGAPATAEDEIAGNFCSQIRNADADQVKAAAQEGDLRRKEAEAEVEDLARQMEPEKKKLDGARATLTSIVKAEIGPAAALLATLETDYALAERELGRIRFESVQGRIGEEHLLAANDKFTDIVNRRTRQEDYVTALREAETARPGSLDRLAEDFRGNLGLTQYLAQHKVYQAAVSAWGDLANRHEKAQETLKSIEAAGPAIQSCIDARLAALEEAAKPVPASATGRLNGQCSSLISVLGEKPTRQSWPLNGEISIRRDAAGNLEFALRTEKRGQEMTARGTYGSRFTATGSIAGIGASMQMTVEGELAEDPARREILRGSGTGTTDGAGDMQVQCKFSWKTDS